ncbi:unnamed protein product, partial [Porites evermanni]
DESILDLEPISEAEQSSFCVEMMKRLNMQRRQNYLCNITLVAKEGNEFKAHRNILSAASPFFSKLFQSDMRENEEGVIRFEEISESILADILKFTYTGSIKVNGENAMNLIMAADYLLLESLKVIAGRFLEKKMSTDNCISTFHFAEKYRCEELVLCSTKFIQDNFTSVAESDEFLNLEADEVEKWISSENILVAAEEDVFRVIVNWVEQNKRERKDKFEQLFRHVRLVLLSRDFLFSDIVTNELVTEHFSILIAAEEDVFRVIVNWVEQNKRERKDKFEQLFRHVRLVLLSRDFLFSDIVTNELVTEHFSILRRVTDAIKLVRAASEDTQIQPARRRLKTHAIVVRGGKKTYCYLPEKDEWKRLADGLSENRNHTTQMINFRDQLFSFPGSRYADTERYDPFFNSWTALSLSRPFEKSSLAVLNGKIHAIYRLRRSNPVIVRYDVELCIWQTISSSQDFHYRYESCVVAFGNCLYVLGGGCSNKAGRFDTAEKKWEEITSMQSRMNSPFGVAIQGKIFVCLNVSRFCLRSLVSLNQTLHAVCTVRENYSRQPDEMIVLSYDPNLNRWIQKTSIPIKKSSEEETYSFQCATLKLSKGMLYRSKIIKIDT